MFNTYKIRDNSSTGKILTEQRRLKTPVECCPRIPRQKQLQSVHTQQHTTQLTNQRPGPTAFSKPAHYIKMTDSHRLDQDWRSFPDNRRMISKMSWAEKQRVL